jgi:hypothetical protein
MSRTFVRVCAVLIVLRSFTDFAKLFQGDAATLVLFGRILHGSDAALPSLAVGLFMLVAGIGMWIGARWALPMAAVYALYVAVNLLSWTITNPEELVHVGQRFSKSTDTAELRRIGAAAFFGYCVVALGTTAGPAWILWKRRVAGTDRG